MGAVKVKERDTHARGTDEEPRRSNVSKADPGLFMWKPLVTGGTRNEDPCEPAFFSI